MCDTVDNACVKQDCLELPFSSIRIISAGIQLEMVQSEWDQRRVNTARWCGYDQDEGI